MVLENEDPYTEGVGYQDRGTKDVVNDHAPSGRETHLYSYPSHSTRET